MSEGLRLEDWIGKRVTVNVYFMAESAYRLTGSEGAEAEPLLVAGVTGFLQGIDAAGVIVLYDPVVDAPTGRGALSSASPENAPRHAFFPWQRISVIERIEGIEDSDAAE
jgi:hypothetical protein